MSKVRNAKKHMIGKADKIIFIARIRSQIVAFIDVERMAIEKDM